MTDQELGICSVEGCEEPVVHVRGAIYREHYFEKRTCEGHRNVSAAIWWDGSKGTPLQEVKA